MKLSICCIAYNHENFIAEALDGFLMQETNFDFEIVIGEDCSSDKTLEMIKHYQQKYPDRIKLLANKTNIGMMRNFIETLKACTGKYIALCEGDDYWTDTFKLQKQVDFLEANKEYAICFTCYKIKNELNNKDTIINSQIGSILIGDVIKANSFSTATSVFVSKYVTSLLQPKLNWIQKTPFGDWTLYLIILFTSKKKAFCLNEVTTVYRIHGGGIHGSLHSSNKQLIKAFKMHVSFYRDIKKYLFKDSYASDIENGIKERKKIIHGLLKTENRPISAFLSKWYFKINSLI